ncbi:winged helix-turn-helix transcriptional regulator [Dickeya fangzhongdai]|uniref:Transcriptional regulator n=1 Tax=Dickeya fangzhongdai TaxID=1778540 RepID=A0A2K8QPG1_9GAMM|nr:helix-turn-helix domain-containing protein [Dickeya fangzhongdai]ATZ95394.1 transcriptional regulator [Dickeya fangzhongdai]QOH48836.1 transcriptional regulator [Dickeya fangzhongdai]QOH53140.1 transcriptional regulator [Dickeya fangzhongdai]WOX99655.1 helix-turn-helix domain-containing protein [Dickeya fangzhongdai]WOY05195.1 helix-turn-helix domain-containing protein [Dickeya fangzhongdai]
MSDLPVFQIDGLQPSLSEQVRRGELQTVDCPSREVLKHMTSLWGVLILLALRGSTLRFSELRRRSPKVSEKMLAQTLQCLEMDGFIHRVSYPVVPPHVEYSLTPLGSEAAEQVSVLTDWIETHLHRVMDARRSNGIGE